VDVALERTRLTTGHQRGNPGQKLGKLSGKRTEKIVVVAAIVFSVLFFQATGYNKFMFWAKMGNIFEERGEYDG